MLKRSILAELHQLKKTSFEQKSLGAAKQTMLKVKFF